VFSLRDRKVVCRVKRVKRSASIVVDARSYDQRKTTGDNQLIGSGELRRVATGGPDVRELNRLGGVLREKESAEAETDIIYDVA